MSEPDFATFFTDKPTVTTIVQDRVYKKLLPQGVQGELRQPCVRFNRTDGARKGTFCVTDTLVAGSFQVDALSPDADQSDDLGDEIRKVLVDYRGRMGACLVNKVILETDQDVGPDPEPGLFVRSLLLTIWYWEDGR